MYSWIPFGGGTRRCPGAAFANMEMMVVLRTVLSEFTLAPTDAPDERLFWLKATLIAGLLLVVLADPALIGDDTKRSLDAYLALKMRIWSDVRPESRDNPLAPLVILAGQPAGGAMDMATAP